MHKERDSADLAYLMQRNAALWPDGAAIIHGERVLSHAELLAECLAAAHCFRSLGLEKGQTVGVFARKSPRAIISFLGAALAGAMFFPLDWNQPPELMGRMLDLAMPSLIVSDHEFLPQLEAAKPYGLGCTVVRLESGGERRKRPWQAELSRPLGESGLPKRKPGDAFYLNCTSGTTGLPKAAVTSYENVFWNTLASVEALQLTRNDVHMCMMPIFVHPHEIFARPIYLGGAMVLEDQISPRVIARSITRHKVTAFMAVASIYETLVRLNDVSEFDFSNLRVPESGGMHVTEALYENFFARFGQRMLPVWGSTETTGIALANCPGQEYRAGSMGRPCPHYKVWISDHNGNELEPGEPGELVVEGPGVCGRYYGEPSPEHSRLSGGRFRTQDVVTRDEDGYFYFLSRESGMMKVAGLKVYPTEIEEVLRAHPGVAEAYVIKTDDPLRGESPKAFVVFREGFEATRSDLRKYCELHLHRNKVPRHFEIRKSIERTPGGKIAWKKLV